MFSLFRLLSFDLPNFDQSMYSKFEVHKSLHPLVNIAVKFDQDLKCCLRLNRKLMKNQLKNNRDMNYFRHRLANRWLKILAIECECAYPELKQCAKLDMCRAQ
jgi:hypothetical protein